MLLVHRGKASFREPSAVGYWLNAGMDVLLLPFDRLRRELYRVGARWFPHLLVEPQPRAFVLALGYAVLALVAAIVWPLGLLALGPILWGVPHVVADVRYLVLQPGYHRQRLRLGLLCLALLASVFGGGIVAGAVAVVLAVVLSDASWSRRGVLLAPALLLLGVVSYWQRPAELVFAHLHNWVAVGVLLLCFERRWHRWALALGMLAASSTLCLLPLEWFALFPKAVDGMGLGYHAFALVPQGSSTWGLRLIFLFAFAQAFHYAVWVRLVPELKRERPAPRSFRASYRALTNDFGPWFLLLVLLGMVALAVGAVFALRTSREAYLRFALFHGYLELAFGAVWWLEGKRSLRDDALRARTA